MQLSRCAFQGARPHLGGRIHGSSQSVMQTVALHPVSHVQGGWPHLHGRIHGSPSSQQLPHHLAVPFVGCTVQGSRAVLQQTAQELGGQRTTVERVLLGVVVQQQQQQQQQQARIGCAGLASASRHPTLQWRYS
jgi:hypothetical protein